MPMRFVRHSAAIAAVLLASTPLLAALGRGDEQESPVLTPAQTMASYKLPPGYKLQLVAAEPLVQDPVAVDFDADGRMWVVEMRGFMPNLAGTGELRPVGRIVVLEDTNDDGRMDKSTVFLDDLGFPTGVAPWRNGILVTCAPDILYAEDTDGDGKADKRETWYHGFTQGNPQHNFV